MGTKQVGETHARRAWVEATVWTERTLMALEHGVKGGVWFSLMDWRTRHNGLGTAHQQWPNAYFAKLGLFNLTTAHALVFQPAKAVNH